MMTTLRRAGLALLVCALALPAAAQSKEKDGDSGGKAKEKIQAALDKAVDAFKKKDLANTIAIFAPDYQGKGRDGKPQNRAQLEATFKSMLASKDTYTAIRYTVQSAAKKGKGAVETTVVGHFEGTTYDAKGKPHKMVSDTVEKMIWTKQKGKDNPWLIKSMETVSDKTLIDGKAPGGASK